MTISPRYTIHQYREDTYKVVCFKRNLDSDGLSLRVHDPAEFQHNDTKLDNNLSRARSMVLQYALCNPWELFFTGTLDKRKYDRFDLDTFMGDLSQWIRDMRKKYGVKFQITNVLNAMPASAAAVLCPWVVYNANGQTLKMSGPVRERFTQTVEWPFQNPNWKSIVRPAMVETMAAHSPLKMSEGAILVDAHGVEVEDKHSLPADKLVVDHYFTKSYEEWVERLAKGSCDPFASRKNEWFLELNPDMTEVVAVYETEKGDT